MAEPKAVGPFQVVRCLGRGGMGVVYECRHPLLPRPVAVKQILSRAASETALTRFLREAELLARIKHAGVVGVHQLGRTSDGPYLVMELVEGTPLDRLVREGPLEPQRAARLVRDLARAVAVVHAAGVLHRDLKPQNAIVRPDDSPVLLDFGLAREVVAERMTKTGEVLGTIAYMSPEQARGRGDLDGRVDVYSLGTILYELLTGRPAFEGSSSLELLAKIISGEAPPPPTSLRDGLSPQLEAIVCMAMAHARDGRYRTAAALAADLDRYLAGEQPLAARVWTRRRRRAVVAAAVVVALSAVGAGAVAAAAGRDDGVAAPVGSAADGGPARPAPRAPLWSVPPGARLTYALALAEVGAEQAIDFGCTLALTADPAGADRLAAFTCEVTRLRCAFGAQETGGGIVFDSDRPDPEHPMAMLQAAVGMPFTCALDPATGDVARFEGFRAIRDAVAAGPRDALLAVMAPAQVDAFVNGVFSDVYIAAAMDALTHVQGDGRVVRWRAGQGAEPGIPPGGGVQTFEALPGEPAGRALRALSTDLRADDRFLFAGTATYEAGRLVAARLRQELVDARGRSCVTEWAMTLEPASSGSSAGR